MQTTKIIVRKLKKADVYKMIHSMREADRQEILAQDRSIKDSLMYGFNNSDKAFAGFINGELACIFGVGRVTLLSNRGVVWFVATPVIEHNQMAFLRVCRRYYAEMCYGYSRMFNYVDARNTLAINWLKWLGFKFEEAEPMGINKIPFHKFEMRIPNHV